MAPKRPFDEALRDLLDRYSDGDLDEMVTEMEEATERVRDAAEGGPGLGKGGEDSDDDD
jgi:hypothetical protein